MTPNSRYQVGHDEWGQLEIFSRKLPAIRMALACSLKNPGESIFVFDRMARLGAEQTWECRDGRIISRDYRRERVQ